MDTSPKTPFTGDSAAISRLVTEVRRGRVPSYAPSLSRANQALADLLTRDPGRLDPAAPDPVFATDPRPRAGEPVPFLPRERLLTREEQRTATECFARALADGALTSGPAVTEFEDALADFLGLPHAVGTGSGTDALVIALQAVGVGHGDEVIMPANSFAATENAVWARGATPVLVDIDPDRHTLDPDLVEAAVGPRTRAILPVHLYGRLADVRALAPIARRHGLRVVEDACQAIGVTGVGRCTDAAVLSFNPYKNFGLTGKAGAVVTRDDEVAARARRFSYHGFDPKRKNVKEDGYGLNARMDNSTAAVGLGLLPRLTLNNYRRAFLARRYLDGLAEAAASGSALLPTSAPDHAWHLFGVRFPAGRAARDAVRIHMRSTGRVETDLYYPVLTHRQQTPLHRDLFGQVALPRTEHLHDTVLHLPLHNNLSLTEQDRVIEALHAALRAALH
ncbi:3-oxo-glucose-6-phosphate--glutamate aminotransferase [Streptomyces pharetrae CZA14]|uniref:3-oxo-glucose-6-phosphate--glutamate aminotransferase n=1 Tax=Streptomyces pharetrae CZA14 TaxID=1144883 RepID=A0ABX3Y8Z1_9ACTN|nr:3-oxo-glucose-6-phosphate--glutamate aminotransferase [Streptomyces pharetrae CZA14]